MIHWLHSFHPQAILFSFGPIRLYWYGLFIVLGILVALSISLKLAKYYKIKSDELFDLVFWLIINGLIGARIYYDLLQFPYYAQHPLDSFKIWQGGLAIHGAVIAGLITIYFFAKKRNISFWSLSSLLVPGLAIAQTIGRWGNYFNQEIFGLPTDKAWGIPIDIINRPINYLANTFFQPTFLYESVGCLIIFLIVGTLNVYLIKEHKLENYYFIWVTTLYMILYSILRFSLEFIRLDDAPMFINMRWPQFISLIIILSSIILLIFNYHAKKSKKLL